MIREKQRTEIERKMQRLLSFGKGTPPDLARHVALALVSGEAPRMRPSAEIVKAARVALVTGDRYSDRNQRLKLEDIFVSCNGYVGEKRDYDRYEASRRRVLRPVELLANKIRVRMLAPDADAESIVAELDEAFESCGVREFVESSRVATAAQDDED